MLEPRVVIPVKDRLGECPRWHCSSQSLYWLDIPSQVLHRYFPATGQHIDIVLSERVSAFAFYRGGGFLFAAGNRLVRAKESGRIHDIGASADLPADSRFNDGAADATGRFWTGALNTARRQDNNLYCFEADTLRTADTMIGASNGIGWSPDNRTMYLADSPRKTIWAYDFDPDAGSAENRRSFVLTSNEPGVPDGITVDQEGGVWCAYWDGWRVVRYDTSGKEISRVSIPTPRPTACAFGGEQMTTLYVTSASDDVSPADAAMAGHLFAVKTYVRGIVPFNVIDQTSLKRE